MKHPVGCPNFTNFLKNRNALSGPGSVVGIATGYGLDGPGIEARWGRDFPHLSRPALGPTHLPHNGYRVLPGVKEGPGREAETSPPSSTVVMEG
jgi:hypothetical protein